METLNTIQLKLQNHKADLGKRYYISYLAIFGSVSRNESTENSDIDILVDFIHPHRY